MASKSLVQYKQLICDRLRAFEIERLGNDQTKLTELEHTSDDAIFKKWLWIFCIVAGPFSYIAVPIIMSLAQLIIPAGAMAILEVFEKLLMGTVFLIFLFALYVSFWSGHLNHRG